MATGECVRVPHQSPCQFANWPHKPIPPVSQPLHTGELEFCRYPFGPRLPAAVSLLHSFRRRFRYHEWAMATLADALLTADAAARRPFAHVLAADRVWLLRLRGEPPEEAALWPDLDAPACQSLARRNADAYAAYLARLDDALLERPVAYRNSRGAAYETPVSDVLDHVLLHASHHRGQTNAALRAAGAEPPHVDWIAWLRAGEPAP